MWRIFGFSSHVAPVSAWEHGSVPERLTGLRGSEVSIRYVAILFLRASLRRSVRVTMGGEQSHEEKTEEEEEADKQKPSAPTQSSGSAAADTPGELPQCQMGNRKVDNMCFMISCTNWY
ncbi:hypothetical protein NQZ68_038986 [Dissostichus eleginoides]|nr:hypothetical protein NQZ68_038986 [Dissostichus eleginoides]